MISAALSGLILSLLGLICVYCLQAARDGRSPYWFSPMSLQDVSRLANAAGPLLPGEACPVLSVPRSYAAGERIIAAVTNVTYVVPNVALKGAALIEHSKLYPSTFPSKTDLVAASGHVKEDGKASFISFYEALLEAKLEADPNFYVTMDDANDEEKEYDELSKPIQALYDNVHTRFGERWDHAQIMDFLQELSDLGVQTVENFDSAFYTFVDDTYNWEAEFTEEYTNELEPNLNDSIASFAIDWQRVWDHALTYDFCTIEFDDLIYIFYSNW